jgi:hypothetical protein
MCSVRNILRAAHSQYVARASQAENIARAAHAQYVELAKILGTSYLVQQQNIIVPKMFFGSQVPDTPAGYLLPVLWFEKNFRVAFYMCL